jgi:Predicted transcriptional regulator containing an HTH domain and an uncharacterized domain shared with the mammalian protein Schlafen
MSKGRKRNITDEEIALIKAMLLRKIPNDRIHFYFNRADRLVSSGRIAQIKSSNYGKDVPEATQGAVDTFLADWEKRYSRIPAVDEGPRPPTHYEVIRALFEKRGKGWFLISGETDEAECKAGFALKPQERFADALRSIAGLANNKGGYVFFGVKDKTYELVGLRDETFRKTDNAEFSRIITTSLDPVPDYEITCLDIDGKSLGVIYVCQHDHRPVVAIKAMNKDLAEGAIYYRYVGESKPIKPGELRQIIAHRERRAVGEFARSMQRVATGSAATLNLNTGEVKGRSGAFVIDKDLLPKIQFIREGEFNEIRGAPTLRLLGDVRPAAHSEAETTTIIRRNVTDDAVLRNFLNQTAVMYPIDYLQRSCYTQRHWLPIFYYMKMAGLTVEETKAILEAEETPYPKICKAAIDRLKGAISAYRKPSTAGLKMLAAIQAGSFPDPKDAKETTTAAHSIGGLENVASNFSGCLEVLTKCLSFVKSSGNGGLRSQIYRSACRLDELIFKSGAAGNK